MSTTRRDSGQLNSKRPAGTGKSATSSKAVQNPKSPAGRSTPSKAASANQTPQTGKRPAQSGRQTLQTGKRPAQSGKQTLQSGKRPAQSGKQTPQSGKQTAQTPKRSPEPIKRSPEHAKRIQEPVKRASSQKKAAPRPSNIHNIEDYRTPKYDGAGTGLRSRNEQKEKQRKKRRFRSIAISVLVVLVLAAAGVLVLLKSSVDKIVGSTDFPNNFQVDGVDLSGMSVSEAETALTTNLERLGKVTFSFTVCGEQTEISLADLGISYKGQSGKELVNDLYSYVHGGSLFTRYRNLHKLNRQVLSIPANYQLNEETAAQTLKNRCVITEGAAEDAGFEKRGEIIRIRKSRVGTLVDTDATITQINEILGNDWDHTGRDLAAVVKEDDPEITTQMLMQMQDCLGSYTTEFGTTDPGRVQNVRNATNLLNGHIVEPGEEFQCNPLMEPYTVENGYLEAGTFDEGEVIQSMGGGICQVSSTLYNAVLFSELEVTWRAPHSMMVHYVSPGRDAAIADDVKDLHFKNSTDYPIYIFGTVEGNKVTFAIMGKETRPKNRTIEFESECQDVYDYRTTYKATDELSYGYSEILSHGYEGGNYYLYKKIYEDGELKDTVLVSQSEYAAANTIIGIGYAGADEDTYYEVLSDVSAKNIEAMNE